MYVDYALTTYKGNTLVLPFSFGRVLNIYDDSRIRKSRLFEDKLKILKKNPVTSSSHLLFTCKQILECEKCTKMLSDILLLPACSATLENMHVKSSQRTLIRYAHN